MNNFPQSYDENYPGVNTFLFAPVDDISAIGEAFAHVIDSITWQGGKDWYTGYAVNDSLSVEEVPEETDHGTIYKCRVKGLLAKDDATLAEFLREMKSYRYVVAVQDLNNYWKLYGSLEKPCLFTCELAKSSEANHYEFAFSAVHTDDAPYFLDDSLI